VLPSWIHIRALTQPIGSEVLRASLGPGESEALALALELKAEALILDDRPARRLALARGLPLMGTAAVLLRAKQAGFIPAVQPLLDELLRVGFRLSPALREKLLTDARERG
jgi:predicted nucleic acid-binding protein